MAEPSNAPARKQIANTMYDQMVFPDYEFHEWPQAVPVNEAGELQPTPYQPPLKSGKIEAWPVVIVHSQAELDALRGPEVTLVPVNPDAPASALRVESEDDIRKALYLQAEQAGVKIDKKWSVARIEDALRTAAAGGEVV